MTQQREIARGDRVFDVADERHIGIVRSVLIRDGVRYVGIRWEETGWLSCLVPARDLRRAPVEHAPEDEQQRMRAALGGRS